MAVNNTKAKVYKTADQDEATKKKLENDLKKDLKVFFEQLASDFAVIYSSTGKVMTMTESYQDELNALLKKHYREVSKKFDYRTRKMLDEEIDTDIYEIVPEAKQNLEKKVAMAIGAFILLRAKNISPKISSTTQDEMLKQTQDYIINQARRGIAVSNAEIASTVSDHIKKWGVAHSETVSTTEVQAVAEKTKKIESATVNQAVTEEAERIKSGGKVNQYDSKPPHEYSRDEINEINEIESLANDIDVGEGATKTWITSGDEKVRSSHLALDGVTIGQDELFVTENGSQLMYAGDMENGALLKDVINCRCSTIYRYDNDVVKMYRNSIYRRKV